MLISHFWFWKIKSSKEVNIITKPGVVIKVAKFWMSPSISVYMCVFVCGMHVCDFPLCSKQEMAVSDHYLKYEVIELIYHWSLKMYHIHMHNALYYFPITAEHYTVNLIKALGKKISFAFVLWYEISWDQKQMYFDN